jgi:antitoxin component YwqK of YwqJK toxin-antitoxin module
MKRTLLIVFYLLPLQSFCQDTQDTISYFNENWERVCCKDSAAFYRIGKYDHGIYDGPIKDYWMDGTLQMTGNYSNYLEDGIFTYFYKNGNKCAIVNMSNGEKLLKGWDQKGNKICKNGNGEFIWYHFSNNSIHFRGSYKNGRHDGLWEEFNLEGKKIEEFDYHKGILLNSWDENGINPLVVEGNGKYVRHYRNGNIKSSGELVNGLVEGECISYYWNGAISEKCYFTKGIITGVHSYYYDNSQLRKEIINKDGGAEVRWYYLNGMISCSGFYSTSGKEIGEWIWYDKNGAVVGSVNYDMR